MERWGKVSQSFRLDAGRTDHSGPLLGISGDERREVAGRGWKRLPAQILEPFSKRGSESAALTALLRMVMISGGVLAGAPIPPHPTPS